MFNPDPGAATFPGTYARQRPYPLPRLPQNTHPGWAPDVFTDFPPGVQPGAHGRGMATTVRDARQPKPPKQAAPTLLSLLTPQQMQTQAQTSVSSMVDPVIKQLTDAINARAAAAAGSVSGLTNSLAAEEAKAQAGTHQIYGDAQANQAKLDAALAAQLGGQGTALANSLATDLAASGQPGTGADQVRANTTGAVNAGSAMGGASLAQLLTEGASAENFSSLLPGFARAQGLAATHDLQGQALSDIADQTGQVTAQVPGLVRQIVGDLQSRNDQAANENERRVERGADLRYQAGRDKIGDAAAEAERRYRAGRDKVGDATTAAATAAAKRDKTRSDNFAWLQHLEGLAKDKAAETGHTYDVVPGPYGRGGIRPHDANPAKPGVQPQDTQATKDKKMAAGIADNTPVASSYAKSSQYLVNRYGLVLGPNPNYAAPTAKPARVDLPLSKATGKYVDSSGNVIASMQGKKPPKQDPKAPRVDLPLSRDRGQYVDASGNPIPSLAGKKPKPTATSGASRASAESKANTLALGIIKAGAATVGKFRTQPKTNVFGEPVTGPHGTPVTVRTRVGDKVARPYYKTLHQAEAAVYDGLKAAGYSDGEIIQFVQKRIDTYYDPGHAGRPLPSLKDKPDPTDKSAFPTTKPKPKRKKSAPRGLGTKPLG